MKKIIALLLVLIVLLLVVYFVSNSGNRDNRIYVSHEMLTRQIEQLGNLEVVKYSIQDMMEYEKTRRWLPNSRAQVKVVGEVIACIDLTKIGVDDVFTKGDSVRIVLPIPEVCHCRLDHSQSKIYNVEFGLWETAELVDEAYKQAEEHLYQQALKMGIAEQSRQNAIVAVTPLLRGLGFKHITINFKTSGDRVPEGNRLLNLDLGMGLK